MNQGMRKLTVAAAVLVALLALSPALVPAARAEDTNLLANGSFESNDGLQPDAWDSDSWDQEEGFSSFYLDPAAGVGGSAAVAVENTEENDARYTQEVTVKENALYKLSGFVKVEGAEGDWGANLSFANTFVHTEPLLDTEGQWQYVEVYGRTVAGQTSLTIFARLGGYGALSHGLALFDDVKLEEVEAVPAGSTEQSLATSQSGSGGAANKDENKHFSLIMVITIAFAVCLLLALRRMGKTEPGVERSSAPSQLLSLGLLALAIRVALALGINGYPNDIGCWLGWSSEVANNSLFGIYTSGIFIDYPPGYLYVLYIVGWVNKLLSSEQVQVLMVKLPSIAADLATAWILYRMARRRLGEREAIFIGLLYAFNPMVILDSSAWGQIDSILALLAVACFWQVYRSRMWQAAAIYGIGLLVKPQMLLFAPVMLGALIVASRNVGGARNAVVLWGKTLGAGLLALVLPALPFWVASGDPLWLFDLYTGTLDTYSYASVNACNLLAFFGGNWVNDSQKLLFLPYWFWGYLGMALVAGLTLWLMVFRERTNRRIFLWAALLLAGMFVMGLRMHERYMFPALALLLVYYVLERDRRALYLFGAFSLTQFLNAAMVLDNLHMPTDVQRSGDFLAVADPMTNAFWVLFIALGMTAAFVYFVYTGINAHRPLIAVGAAVEPDAQTQVERVEESLRRDPAHGRIRLVRKDWLLMGGLTLVYAIVALLYLGDTKLPQTFWHGKNTGQSVTIDLGDNYSLGQIWHIDSLTKGNFEVSTSEDGEIWTDQLLIWHKADAAGEEDADDDLGIYKWTINDVDFTARYVRLTVTTPPVRLLEIVFKDMDGNQIPPAGITQESTGSIAEGEKLIDEQELTPSRPSFLNSTYFDEIYHARTGWEFTQGNIVPYENTHPPLGKDLIALGIEIFGMTPFGWRIMGTLVGILMVPAMYLFGMVLFRRTRYAFLTSFLFTFDFMHFVQTRIATIDSYAVLFIILMYLFMFLYLRRNFNSQPLRSTLLPLALSGVMFGLGAASKWICIYAGGGLAVLLFYSLYRRWREYDAVARGEALTGEDDEPLARTATEGFWKKVIVTLLWCVLFFLVVPMLIYCASYLPFNQGSGDMWNFKYMWNNQSSMFNYHTNLVDSHPFRSPWYQWPLMLKPMWFYKADYLPDGWMGSIATFGNPAVWWAGAAAMVWLGVRLFRGKKFGKTEAFLLLGLLSQFLPWVLVPRSMFIYHYFASVPFFVAAIVLYIRQWEAGHPGQERKVYVYLAIVLGLFIFFYPVLSGLPIPSWYGALLKWMPTWYFTY